MADNGDPGMLANKDKAGLAAIAALAAEDGEFAADVIRL